MENFKLGNRVAFECGNKMGVKIGTVEGISTDFRIKVRFDLGYSRWVSPAKLEVITDQNGNAKWAK